MSIDLPDDLPDDPDYYVLEHYFCVLVCDVFPVPAFADGFQKTYKNVVGGVSLVV